MNSAIDHISRLLNIHFGIKPKLIVLLPGYDNQNYKIICKNGQMCVAKLHINPHLLPFLEAECRLLDFLSAQMPGKFPEVIRTVSNAYYFRDDSKVVRLFSWLEGSFLAEKTITEKTAASLGTFLAEMNKTLMGYRDPVIKSRELSWDLQRFTELQNKMDVIPDPALKKLIHHFLLQYNMEVLPRLPELRNSIIHNDANDNNILVRDEQVTGLIDFGDAVYGPVIQEVAVAMTYLMMDLEEPLEIAIPFLKSYHSSFHLEDKEVDLLYFLVGARLSISLIHSFETILQGKADEYTLISQQPAIDLLKKWIGISPDKVSRFVRKALGMPVTEITDYKAEIKKRNKFIGKILSVSYQTPIRMQRAAFQYMFDADGNTYLDAYNNIPHVGHQHPRVVEAAQRQMAKLNTNTRYLYDQLAAYAERLLAKFPKPLNKVFFVNSGSEASDLAIRIAQTVTGHKQIAVLEHGYHGNTRMGIDISHYKFAGKGGDGAKDFVTVLPIPDTYRGKYRTD
ncbi:MAG: aminotransferase class III-fold pyridoxal phosphate-dependent enzyme, partial [Bacteroidales bacterium]|nr:aminotransferase class III-fold pyridoxal phosphate-dependent enzyme [Bacteroidales bacterium]